MIKRASVVEEFLFPAGASGEMVTVLELARQFAPASDPILILGERGTGKTSIAGQIHAWSGRPGAFVPYPLSSTSDELCLDDFFGHAQGAFTGAIHVRRGFLDEASEGTLFLDEFGTATPRMQRFLLSVLENRGYRPAGESKLRTVTARFVLATNVDVETDRNLDGFRRDLLDRIGFLQLTIPPLRKRRREILPLFRRFLASARGLPEGAVVEITREVGTILLGARWAGNVRELRSVARYAALRAGRDEPIDQRHLPAAFLSGREAAVSRKLPLTDKALQDALRRTGGNVSKAAQLLKIDRRTIQRHLKACGGWPALRDRDLSAAAGQDCDMPQADEGDDSRQIPDA